MWFTYFTSCCLTRYYTYIFIYIASISPYVPANMLCNFLFYFREICRDDRRRRSLVVVRRSFVVRLFVVSSSSLRSRLVTYHLPLNLIYA